MGARIGFFGIDARTEVRRPLAFQGPHLITWAAYAETSQLSWNLPHHIRSITKRAQRVKSFLVSYHALDCLAWNSHSLSCMFAWLYLMAPLTCYKRLTWLENIFSSPLIAPIKFLNKRFGFGMYSLLVFCDMQMLMSHRRRFLQPLRWKRRLVGRSRWPLHCSHTQEGTPIPCGTASIAFCGILCSNHDPRWRRSSGSSREVLLKS